MEALEYFIWILHVLRFESRNFAEIGKSIGCSCECQKKESTVKERYFPDGQQTGKSKLKTNIKIIDIISPSFSNLYLDTLANRNTPRNSSYESARFELSVDPPNIINFMRQRTYIYLLLVWYLRGAHQQATAISPGFVQWAQGDRNAEGELPPPPIGVLEGHDSTGMDPRQLQGKLSKSVNAATFDRFHDALLNLPETRRPPEENVSFGGGETRDFAHALPEHD